MLLAVSGNHFLSQEMPVDVSVAMTLEGDVFVTGAHPLPDTYDISRFTDEIRALSPLRRHRINTGVVQCEGNIYAFGELLGETSTHCFASLTQSTAAFPYSETQSLQCCNTCCYDMENRSKGGSGCGSV